MHGKRQKNLLSEGVKAFLALITCIAGGEASAGEVWNGSNLTIYGNNVQKSRIGPVLISIFNSDG